MEEAASPAVAWIEMVFFKMFLASYPGIRGMKFVIAH
jgi:hypothetical protein